jgi:hypothetical protein
MTTSLLAGGAGAKVVHFGSARHDNVVNPLGLSVICLSLIKKHSDNNILKNSPKFVQSMEPSQIQGKFPTRRIFCPDLSTETVDSFPLAGPPASVQPRAGITG